MADNNPFMGDGEGDGSLMPASHRPIRNTVEFTSEKIPKGPLGFVGNGNLLGGVNFLVVSSINGLIPVDGLDAGYNIQSHNVSKEGDDQVHSFLINAWSKDTAKVVAKVNAAPSLADLAIRRTDVVSAEEDTPRRTASTWRVKVRVKDRKVEEDVQDKRDEATELM